MDEIKEQIDSLLGLKSELVHVRKDVELRYNTPTGIIIFSVTLYNTDGKWKFGGTMFASSNVSELLRYFK